jgi:hypothetical protein
MSPITKGLRRMLHVVTINIIRVTIYHQTMSSGCSKPCSYGFGNSFEIRLAACYINLFNYSVYGMELEMLAAFLRNVYKKI